MSNVSFIIIVVTFWAGAVFGASLGAFAVGRLCAQRESVAERSEEWLSH